MPSNKLSYYTAYAGTVFMAILLLAACSVNVDKGANGKDKKVDINTFAGGIHVSHDADPSETGLPLYPGAQLRVDESSDDKGANVNISGFGYGLKVVALDYQSDEPPSKILAFYKDQLKKYGNVLECHTSKENWNISIGNKTNSNELTCSGTTSGSETELKAGKQDNQHIVSVQSQGNGSRFTLVYVRAHGKDTDI
jgi:hypothetical protein